MPPPPQPLVQEGLDSQPEQEDEESEEEIEDGLEKEEVTTDIKGSRSKKPFFYLLPSEGWKSGDRPGKVWPAATWISLKYLFKLGILYFVNPLLIPARVRMGGPGVKRTRSWMQLRGHSSLYSAMAWKVSLPFGCCHVKMCIWWVFLLQLHI